VRVIVPSKVKIAPGSHRLMFKAQAADDSTIQRAEKATLIAPKEY
jgi:hypothetical protein